MEPLLLITQLSHQNSPAAITKTFFLFMFMAFISTMLSQCYRKRKRSSALPPGPTPWPLLGSLPAMWTSHTKPHQWVHSQMKELDTEIACIRLRSTYIIPVTSPELAVEFLKTYDSVFASRSSICNTLNILSRGYLSTAFTPLGDQWRKMRRILASEILNPSTLHRLLGHRMAEADALLRYIFELSRSSEGGVVNVRSITQHYCGNIIRRMLFNRKYYGEEREDGGPTCYEEEHNQALLTILRHVNSFSISDFMPCLKTFDLDGHERIMRSALKVVRKYDEPIIDERVQQRKKDEKTQGFEDILDILISLKDENAKPLLSIEEIKAQIMELQIATIDNPSNAVEWAMAEVLNQPKILKKAVEELDRVIGRERLVQESDIPKLKYLTACARESFRLHPFSPFNVPHVSNKDIIVSGYFIPKGSQVMLSRLGLGRNPRIWKDPMKFDPERHLGDETVELGLSESSLRFITFTRGRRGCVGSSLGTNITMMMFARLLHGFSWSFPKGTAKMELCESDELTLSKPLHLHAEPRLSHNMYP